MTDRETVWVEAPARLHFGVLDLRGAPGRYFGGLGAAVREPSLLAQVDAAPEVEAGGADAERAARYARRFLDHHRLPGGARITVHRAIPAHAGLGSGTQLALAVGRALAELHGLTLSPAALAQSVGRGLRSAVGTWAFHLGGFILEGGRAPDRDEIAPLLARHTLPAEWRYVAAVPPGAPGLSGASEEAALRTLPPPPDRDVERVSHLVHAQLVPALLAADLAGFGAALSEIQRITGGWFAPLQGGPFAPGLTAQLVEALSRAGAAGVGQSSWGPTAYAIAADQSAAARLAARARDVMGGRGAVFSGPFAAHGARVQRGAPLAPTD